MSETITIGIDHGYAAIKTTHFSFPTGLVRYEHEPYTRKDVLEYDGEYYVVGTGRQPLQKDKTLTGDYYLLTLAAIAESGLDVRAMPTIFLGGGAALMKQYVRASDGLCRPLILDDVCLNAKGYEHLVGQMSRGVKGG